MISNEQKQKLISELKKTPFIGVACKNSGISPASYHRWRSEDAWFREQSDLALREGRVPINDRAESVVVKHVNQNNLSAAKWWLTIHHDDYKKLSAVEKEDRRPTLLGHIKELILGREKKSGATPPSSPDTEPPASVN